MTREQALDELLAVEMELTRLAARRVDLRRIVLMTEYSPQRPPLARPIAGHTRAVPRNSVSEATLKALKEAGEPMTVAELAILLDSNTNAVNLTLDRLRSKGLVNNERLPRGRSTVNKWSLAVHPDPTSNGAL